MQLIKVKLAGFKSFVDPTTIDTPSTLVAIVGPNGCGKSNVIDAITWVMGESSPKQLRGESMTDVIFNGSNARKPVGQASVELVFDNSDGTIGGEYAKFAEISIKRVINRDSDSTYYLNGTRCRKRDVVDIFLHTGLGARSYTIIGQNTIVEMAEAKPDQLRAHLERAAGIAKYKERRHETELRINRTQENLARVNDLCAELDKQLSKLKHQANVAEKFKVLKAEERQVRAELYGMQWQALNTQMSDHALTIQREETALEGQLTALGATDRELETLHDNQREANDAFQAVQGRYYQAGNHIAQLEQTIAHHKERAAAWRQALGQADQESARMQKELTETTDALEGVTTDIQKLEPAHHAAQEEAQTLQIALNQAEEAMQTWQQRWDDVNQKIAKANQLAQVEKNHSEHLEQKITGLNKRFTQLTEESGRFQFDALQTELTVLSQQISEMETTLTTLLDELNTLREAIKNEQTAQQTQLRELDQRRSELQKLRGQQASLSALQQTALGQRDQRLSPWLTQHQLNQQSRLAQHIQVEAGWERAVEKVLGLTLQAICVDEWDHLAPHLDTFQAGNVCLFANQATFLASDNQSNALSQKTLLDKIHSTLPLASLLSGIYIADSLVEALALAKQLSPQESVVTRDGIWLSQHWLKVLRDEDPAAGVFQREQELKQLAKQIADLETAQAELEQAIQARREQLQAQESQRERLQQTYHQSQTQLGQVTAQYKIKQERLAEMRRQSERIKTELEECEVAESAAKQDLQEAKATWENALRELEALNEQRDAFIGERDKARSQLQTMRDTARQQTDAVHQLAMQLQNKRSQRNVLTQNQARFNTELASLLERQAGLKAELSAMQSLDELQQTLKQALDQHVQLEETLREAKEAMSSIEHQFRTLEQKRQTCERDAQHIRSQLEALRLEWQGWKVKAESIQEQIEEGGHVLQAVLEALTAIENQDIESWQAKLSQITQRIGRLGAINLVAIDEYATCLERKEYLDKQLADLQSGLQMLEDAIAKIDKETRARFKDTFDKVNEQFQTLFPTIFGGGKAYLELTSDNLLEAGVGMMACPPGKRNSTVQLLSGGEKSLTAIALIFSIFHLNPAPFCLLDEVDAALDDANVLRFTRIVKSMADKTQFIFISHNKMTIEMGNQLIGVTMNEPGVSRLVSVDIEKAISMAEA